jgi:hypothetical protein
MFFRKPTRSIAGRTPAVAVAIGINAIVNSSSIGGVARAQALAQAGQNQRVRRSGS